MDVQLSVLLYFTKGIKYASCKQHDDPEMWVDAIYQWIEEFSSTKTSPLNPYIFSFFDVDTLSFVLNYGMTQVSKKIKVDVPTSYDLIVYVVEQLLKTDNNSTL